MPLVENHYKTRLKYENEKVTSYPSYSLQNEALVIFLILLKPKPSLTLLRTLYSFVRDSSFFVKLFHENIPTPSLYFFLKTMSHMTAMCTGFVFF